MKDVSQDIGELAIKEEITVTEATIQYFEENELDYDLIGKEYKISPALVDKIRLEALEAKTIKPEDDNDTTLDLY